jgi:hypothetical protein
MDYLRIRGVTKEMVYTYFNFRETDGSVTEHPVFCVEPNIRGAKQLIRDYGDLNNTDGVPYKVDAKVADNMLEMILTYGFPHQAPAVLGLTTNEDSYYATKAVLWAYLDGATIADISINPANPDQVTADKVYKAAQRIYGFATSVAASGAGGVEPILTLAKNGDCTDDGDNCVQKYILTASKWALGDVEFSWSEVPPNGTKLYSEDGAEITNMKMDAETYLNYKVNGTEITAKFPKEAVDDELGEGANAAVTWSSPVLTAKVTLSGTNFYIAQYTREGVKQGQKYLIEGDPWVTLETSAAAQITKEPGDDDIKYDLGLKIVKLETGTLIPLEGAIFKVLNPRGESIGSYATDSNGEINIKVTEEGNYTATELTPPQYHILPKHTLQNVTIMNNEYKTLTFENEPYRRLTVSKRDEANGKSLAGATIRIKNLTTNVTNTATTDISGNVTFDLLPTGGYSIEEITSPEGYVLDTTVHTVSVTSLTTDVTSYTLTNKALPGLRLLKLDSLTRKAITGVVFEIYKDAALYGEYTTDMNGEIFLPDVPLRTYSAKEKSTVPP